MSSEPEPKHPRPGPDSTDHIAEEMLAAEGLAGLGRWHWHPGAAEVTLSPGMDRVVGLLKRTPAISARRLLRLLGGTDRRAVLERIRLILSGTDARDLEVSIKGFDAGLRKVSVMFRSRRNEVWGVCHDITLMRMVSAALDRSEGRWEIALESARQGVWDADLETGIIYHSRTWRTMRGMNAAFDPRDTHENWVTRVHPDDIERCLKQIRDQHSGLVERSAMVYRERHIDGRYIWISSAGAPVAWFPDGRVKRLIGTDTEITESKLAEEETARLSQRLELALDVSRIGVFEANLNTGELYWDARVRHMYGRTGDSPIGASEWEDALHPEDAETAVANVWTAVQRQSSYDSQFRIIRPDGEVRTIRTKGTFRRDLDGTPKVLGANWDVTEEVLAKQELERAKELAEARNCALEEIKSQIEHNALHDTLTSLPNRRYLDTWLIEAEARCHKTGSSVALLHIDLDRFKQINDTLGHMAGDAMLIHAAKLLRANLTADDFVARVGGDEFVLVCVVKPSDTRLETLARRIVEQMRQPVPYEGHFCRFGASIGIAIQAGAAVDRKRLLIDADIALYRAKRRGRNGYEYFSEALQAETVNTKRVADDILRGIEQDEFLPYYQPLFDARTLELVGVEALARWNHPNGVLAPASFLKIAEDLNVVTSIDRLILEGALADFNRWNDTGLVVPSISVNVSFRRLLDETLIESLRGLPIRPGTLSFELLESIFLDEPDDMLKWNLEQIRALGIDLSIDDFGTGHASILSVVKLRPGRFKIDRQFIADIERSESERRIVRSLVDIGRSLSIKVVAEGVETMEQAYILRDLGCDVLQGYALGRPMPAAHFEEMAQRRGWRKAS